MRTAVALGVLVAIAACKDPQPSQEFLAATAALERTIAATLDPTYADPAFDAIEDLFRAVPSDASDFESAQTIAEEIRKAREGARARDRAIGADLERDKNAVIRPPRKDHDASHRCRPASREAEARHPSPD